MVGGEGSLSKDPCLEVARSVGCGLERTVGMALERSQQVLRRAFVVKKRW